jgi:hypothetical protein
MTHAAPDRSKPLEERRKLRDQQMRQACSLVVQERNAQLISGMSEQKLLDAKILASSQVFHKLA